MDEVVVSSSSEPGSQNGPVPPGGWCPKRGSPARGAKIEHQWIMMRPMFGGPPSGDLMNWMECACCGAKQRRSGPLIPEEKHPTPSTSEREVAVTSVRITRDTLMDLLGLCENNRSDQNAANEDYAAADAALKAISKRLDVEDLAGALAALDSLEARAGDALELQVKLNTARGRERDLLRRVLSLEAASADQVAVRMRVRWANVALGFMSAVGVMLVVKLGLWLF